MKKLNKVMSMMEMCMCIMCMLCYAHFSDALSVIRMRCRTA